MNNNRARLWRSVSFFIGLFLIMGITVAGAQEELSTMDRQILQAEILKKIRESYVDTTLTLGDVMDGAIKGMIDTLDPHSSYMPAKAAADFTEKIQGNFEGIGITFAMIDGKITVIEVIKDGPSEKAGLKSRDKIVKIDGRDVVGIDQDQVRELLRGESESKVTVHIERPGRPELLKVEITRGRVNVDSVSQAYMINNDTGYIKITKFTVPTHYEVNTHLKKLHAQGMKKLIVDLRGNSGGALDAAVRVVDTFLKEKNLLIVETRGKNARDNQRYKSTGEGDFSDIPVIVMINHASASASEIVAGALQDHDRGLIVGQTSFGKGLVMNQYPMRYLNKDLGSLILSTAHYYTPSGRLIQRPYDNGREEYIKEGFDDVDPNASDSSKTGKPVFHTDLGREVYGGGGITPDKSLAPLRRLNSLERELRNSNIMFEFADGYLTRHNDVPGTFSEFRDNYTIPDSEIELFRKYIKDKGIAVDNGVQFRDELAKLITKYTLPETSADIIEKSLKEADIDVNSSLFISSVDYIQREIKSQIALMMWGDEARFKVWQTEDTELYGALSYFDEARELLEKRIALSRMETADSPKN